MGIADRGLNYCVGNSVIMTCSHQHTFKDKKAIKVDVGSDACELVNCKVIPFNHPLQREDDCINLRKYNPNKPCYFHLKESSKRWGCAWKL